MVEILDLDYLSAFSPLAEGAPIGRGGGNCSMNLIYCCSFMLSALKGQHPLAQGKRPQGATPWVCFVLIYQRPERAKALQQGMNSIQYIKMLLPFQGANTIWLALPRVSSHVVRLALGYVLLAFQAVPSPTFQTCTTARSAPIRCAPSR